jgi:xylulokinase
MLCYPKWLVADMRRYIQETAGIKKENCLISTTHTHSGPEARAVPFYPEKEYEVMYPRYLDDMAKNVEIGSEGLVFHPYLNGELTPYGNPNLCADFVGARASHTKAHFARAVLEGVAMSMLDCKVTLNDFNIPHKDEAIIIGGGGKSPLWRQMIADSLGITLLEMKYADSSFGSAMLAGVAMGIFKDSQSAVKTCNKVVSQTHPNKENTEKYRKLFKRYKAIQKALEPIYNGEKNRARV